MAAFHPTTALQLQPALFPPRCKRRALTLTLSPPCQPVPSPSPTARSSKPPVTNPVPSPPLTPCTNPPSEIVLCHATADFDSLAAAVGLARLRSPNCSVVIPAGTHTAVRRYLSLHKQLFPLLDAKLVEKDRLRWVGVADTSYVKRLGLGREWLQGADVLVLDHHVCSGREGVIGAEHVGGTLEYIVDRVGAASTMVVEMMRERAVEPSRAEATLLALGIHTDTGSLSYESTTPRDAGALAWLLERGACQRSIARFARNYLTMEQQRLLAQALDGMEVVSHGGVSVARVVVETREFVKGMAAVAQAAVELADIDVVLLASVCAGRSGVKQVSLIGRARGRVEGVDLNRLFGPYGGGGHAKAASASLKMVDGGEVEGLMESLVGRLYEGMPPPVLARDFMSEDVRCIGEWDKMHVAKGVLFDSGHTGLAVIREDGSLVGVVSRQDVAIAEKKGLLTTPVKGWVAREAITVGMDTPLHEVEALLVGNNIGRLPVVSEGKVVGIITRSDVLLQRRLCTPCA
eukprot:GFKZ01001125.1.p1 GENE.GFKZ01001125.1~~GFKZ01001125.1.p1  ORF type:complete len:518 (-),score=66.12 GFKZ01001125.1:951-2504(-)